MGIFKEYLNDLGYEDAKKMILVILEIMSKDKPKKVEKIEQTEEKT